MKTRKCPRCKDDFEPETANQRVCTAEHTKDCVVCGKSFPWDKRKKTCSTLCTAALRRQNTPEKECQWCKTKFKPAGALMKYCTLDHTKDCENCGKSFIIKDMNRISKSCSTSCASALSHTEDSRDVRRKNSLEKYGTEHVTQSKELKAKIKLGQDSSKKDTRFGTPLSQAQIKDKFGVDNVSKLDTVKLKKIASSQSKYGTDNPMQNKEVAEKALSSTIKIYGKPAYQLAQEGLLKKHNLKAPSKVHITNLEEWHNFSIWVKKEFEASGKLHIDSVANYFNVSPMTVGKMKTKQHLDMFFHTYSSKQEQKFIDFLSDNHSDVSYVRNCRSVIAPKEVDFYFPEFNLAVEISPTSTHHSLEHIEDGRWNTTKDSDYHVSKALDCEKAGIQLITVFDWMNWDKLMKLISYKLHSSERIFARKTIAKVVEKKSGTKLAKELKTFVDDNHALGFNGRGTTYYSYLTKDDEIVAVAGWGKVRSLNPKSKAADDGTWELTRMCFKYGNSVVGGASKLMKAFIGFMKAEDVELHKIVTFSDFDLGFGSVYEKIGFSLVSVPKAGLNFVHPVLASNDGSAFRVKATSLNLAGADRLLKGFPGYVSVGLVCVCDDEFHENASCLPKNKDIVLSYGFVPVYDCGYKKWVYLVD